MRLKDGYALSINAKFVDGTDTMAFYVLGLSEFGNICWTRE